ncbi:cobalt-precorrin-5B (C(1))-methyltransferase [Desulfovibrio mangrovi]|uniref:cobalt-precorrin-5B (C(1))-methyltransferase n=1 Tax=Desulfovibrio mangrovi TaxID=2976983 RepID=UPI00224837AC|nr:cobalt-precorrin-5B (C(1))-methyltransferase [Desulfovibrio mangrovi]UZP68956.1 cobalt-precorrin-5B (C(1))-methyltransferase [Desulfovibrio mangrovi]
MNATEYEASRADGLREGFTTGTAATAAAVAALHLLLGGTGPEVVNVPLPPFPPDDGNENSRLDIPIVNCFVADEGEIPSATGQVIKDGGDDPDATHGALIQARVRLAGADGTVTLDGGEGVGRVTLPGLPVPVGEAAINPEPRKQIAAAVRELCVRYGYTGGVEVLVSVPDGAERAKNTMNARLGIMGGISILGTRGTVRPFSHSAWMATIAQGLDVARAAGCECIGFSTGRRSERLLMAQYPEWPQLAFVQAADFAAFSLEQAAAKGFTKIAWGCFFGKLVKLAQGHAYTHAQTVDLDFSLLADWCREAGAPDDIAVQVRNANTARQALEIIDNGTYMQDIVVAIARRAKQKAMHWTGGTVAVTVHVFDFDGRQFAVA